VPSAGVGFCGSICGCFSDGRSFRARGAACLRGVRGDYADSRPRRAVACRRGCTGHTQLGRCCAETHNRTRTHASGNWTFRNGNGTWSGDGTVPGEIYTVHWLCCGRRCSPRILSIVLTLRLATHFSRQLPSLTQCSSLLARSALTPHLLARSVLTPHLLARSAHVLLPPAVTVHTRSPHS